MGGSFDLRGFNRIAFSCPVQIVQQSGGSEKQFYFSAYDWMSQGRQSRALRCHRDQAPALHCPSRVVRWPEITVLPLVSHLHPGREAEAKWCVPVGATAASFSSSSARTQPPSARELFQHLLVCLFGGMLLPSNTANSE